MQDTMQDATEAFIDSLQANKETEPLMTYVYSSSIALDEHHIVPRSRESAIQEIHSLTL